MWGPGGAKLHRSSTVMPYKMEGERQSRTVLVKWYRGQDNNVLSYASIKTFHIISFDYPIIFFFTTLAGCHTKQFQEINWISFHFLSWRIKYVREYNAYHNLKPISYLPMITAHAFSIVLAALPMHQYITSPQIMLLSQTKTYIHYLQIYMFIIHIYYMHVCLRWHSQTIEDLVPQEREGGSRVSSGEKQV